MSRPTLIPPDPSRCQAERPNGHTFMTLGGAPGLVRCESKPTVIATETKAPHGSMSLCDACWKVFNEQMPLGAATFRPVSQEAVS